VFLWRAVSGVSVWRAAFVHVGSAYWHYMIGGVFAVVKGGFSRVLHDGGCAHEYVVRRRAGDSRLRGNDGRGDGYDGTEGGYDVMGAGGEIPAYAGMTWVGVGMTERTQAGHVGREGERSV